MDYEKEGEIQGAVGTVIFLITGVGVAVLVLVFVGALGGQTYQLIEPNIDQISQETVNDTITIINDTAVSLSHNSVVLSSLIASNSTGNTTHFRTRLIGLNNFTIDANAGLVTGRQDLLTGNAIDFSYTYGNPDIEGHVRNSIISSFSALQTTADYMPIIVLAVVIFIVLGIVLSMGAMGGGNKGGGSVL